MFGDTVLQSHVLSSSLYSPTPSVMSSSATSQDLQDLREIPNNSPSRTFWKLARLSLAPVKYRVKKLTSLDSSKRLGPSPLDSKSLSPLHLATTHASSHSKNDEGNASSAEVKKPSPMAFTVDLGSTGGSDEDDNKEDKKLDITASISKWAPKHRRNLSLTKVEENKKVEERIGKPPVGRPRSGTVGSGAPGRRVGGYHSEGYFSSDQDDEPRRAELKSPRSPRTPELKSPLIPGGLVKSPSQSSIRKISVGREVGSGRSCCKGSDKKPSVAESSGRVNKGDKSCKNKMGSDSRKNSCASISGANNTCSQDNKNHDDGDDDVSEAGTYTIEKDSPTPDEVSARGDIERVFGILNDEVNPSGPTSGISQGASPITGAINSQESFTDSDKFKNSTLSRSSPNWIHQWAAQVAEHTKGPPGSPPSPSIASSKPSLMGASLASSLPSPRGLSTNPMTSSLDSNDLRPRRKLPTPPALQTTGYSPKPESDPESSTKMWRELPPQSHQDNLTSDTESYLRETQHLVSSLQARVDLNKSALRGSSFESHDSGGDSDDIDTSTSYPIINDDERLSAALRSKLRLSGLDCLSKTPINSSSLSSSMILSPRKADNKLSNRLMKRERSVLSDCGGYENYNKRQENNLQSDSSSESSEPIKDKNKIIDNNPPLKFNRAFSLRRARLGCDDSPPVDNKKKTVRPSSAGASSGSRKATLASTKSHQSTDGGSPRSTSSQGNKTDFGRSDGGRFSLRIPRTGSTSAVIKSPSKTSVKKEISGVLRRPAPRSNSTMSSKEIDFQNWKRRKNYDPMKAAAEGKKKVPVEKKMDRSSTNHTLNSSDHNDSSPPNSLLRSASFHGTEGVAASGRWPRRNHPIYTSEDDGPLSLEEESRIIRLQITPFPLLSTLTHLSRPLVPHSSPLRRSPTSPHQLVVDGHTPPASPGRLAAARRRGSFGYSDDGDLATASPSRKISLDESGSEGKKSPSSGAFSTGSRNGGNGVGGRSKAKMEALDNLVISTIHSLSVKVRTISETLLQKLKSQYDEEGDRAALLEEVLCHLTEAEGGGLSGTGTRSTSRELAGILRNLKKIEDALQVIDRVMICGDEEEDLDEDYDLDPRSGQDWPDESDY